MRRLFWKFFLLIAVAQLAVNAAVGAAFWMFGPVRGGFIEAPQRMAGSFRVENLQGERGNSTDRNAMSAARDEILAPDYALPALLPGDFNARDLQSRAPAGMQRVFRPPPLGFRMPIMPIAMALFGSLLCAALLAFYLAKPIRTLRFAFDKAADGDLRQRIAPIMEKRNDGLANLGRDFDSMAMRLQAVLENQRRLFHDVSHELRSPLARLQIACGLAREHPDTVPSSLERIERECQRMDELVGELLTLAKIESGEVGEACTNVELHTLMTEVVDDVRFEASSALRSITLVGSQQLIVTGRAALLRRAAENVVRNALKHSSADIFVELAVDSGFACICVDDSGSGVPNADLEAIFRPFVRVGMHDAAGYGLGLAIAREVIAMHAGTICAENRPAGGLRVKIALPLKSDSA